MIYRTDLERARDQIGRTLPDLELALRHAEDWISTHQPANRGELGGTTNPRDLDEREEDRRVHRLALHASTQIPHLVRAVVRAAADLENLVVRCTAIVDHEQLADPDGCVSCARVPGCWNPTDPKRPGLQLCRWCADIQAGTGRLPAIEAVRIYHHQSPNAAGRYITRSTATA